MKTKNIARAIILTAVTVALSPVFFPVGIAKCYPAQHLVNVLSAVMLGPWYAVGIAFSASLIRNIMGLGSLLAFPGSIIGALLAGLAYKFSKNIYVSGIGELIGTGILGAVVSAWIVGPILIEKSMSVTIMIIAFSISSAGGVVLALVSLNILKKAKIWQQSERVVRKDNLKT